MTLIHQVILVVAIKESLQDFEMAFPKLEYLLQTSGTLLQYAI